MEDYEKKYKEALRRANAKIETYNHLGNTSAVKSICEIFPELKESEDEIVRKEIISFLRSKNGYMNPDEDWDFHNRWLPWLEKQGSRKQLYIRFGDIPANEKSKIYRGEEEIGEEDGVSVYPAFEVDGNVVLGLSLPITKTSLYTQQHLLEYDNRPCYLVSGDCVGKGADGEPLIKNVSVIKQLDNYRIKEINKQDEQKPILDFKAKDWYVSKVDGKIHNIYYSVDKVEPKFNVDDWIISDTVAKDYRIVKINEIKDGNYYITSIYGYQGFNSFDVFEKDYHLWTIEDAKKGDILQANKCTLIFDSLTKDIDGNTVISSWYYCDTKTFYGIGTCKPDLWVIEGVVPATKEQCDLLFQKMKEAGYYWNPEKKELRFKPKFDVGDWVVEGDVVAQILDNQKYAFVGLDTKGNDFVCNYGHADSIHLWTIKDAKAGDVLSWDDSKCIALFKTVYDEESFNSYGFVGGCTGAFKSEPSYHDIKGAHPASKEQQDLLFQKMKESGYTWDVEKKELKKISQEYPLTPNECCKPAWSEEDEKIIETMCKEANLKPSEVEWLKSIKDRLKGE